MSDNGMSETRLWQPLYDTSCAREKTVQDGMFLLPGYQTLLLQLGGLRYGSDKDERSSRESTLEALEVGGG